MTQGTDPADEARYKPLGELFNDKKGSVTVDIIQGDAGGGAVNAQAKLIALVASGTAPDVFWRGIPRPASLGAEDARQGAPPREAGRGIAQWCGH
ncbi:MAG: hypothetical protein EB140_10595 [Proteobacteria bacterium]|nr:hypothetical protein [Pseudomonadota bacterium]